jgi:hypothetical protein
VSADTWPLAAACCPARNAAAQPITEQQSVLSCCRCIYTRTNQPSGWGVTQPYTALWPLPRALLSAADWHHTVSHVRGADAAALTVSKPSEHMQAPALQTLHAARPGVTVRRERVVFSHCLLLAKHTSVGHTKVLGKTEQTESRRARYICTVHNTLEVALPAAQPPNTHTLQSHQSLGVPKKPEAGSKECHTVGHTKDADVSWLLLLPHCCKVPIPAGCSMSPFALLAQCWMHAAHPSKACCPCQHTRTC